MHSRQLFRSVFCLILSVAFGGWGVGLTRGQTSNVFTLQVGAGTATPATTLVNHTNFWNYHRGTTAPQANWQTVADASLDTTWTNAMGGFGYGDPGIVGESTTVNGVINVCTTFYIRRTFAVTSAPDATAHLQLNVDYDDGFVAYLDGVEIARSMLINAAGTFVTNTATTGGNSHEASCCNAPTHPAETFDCGAVSNRLAPGNHILAFITVNQTLSSSDLHIIPDLLVTGSASSSVDGPLLSVVKTNSILLSGTNTMTGSARVMVNGDEANFNPVQGTWSQTQALAAGVNHLNIQSVDATGQILAATNRLVVADLGSVSVGGTLASNTVWNASNGLVRLTNSVVVPAGGSLTIQDGVVVLANANCSIAATNATLIATGTTDRVTYFLPADGVTTNWGELVVDGTNGAMLLQHIETLAGHVEIVDGAMGTLEDSYFHDYLTAAPAIIHTFGTPNHVTLNLRRCHVAHYQEVLCQMGTNYIEGCLCEYQGYSGDGIDFDAGQRGSHIQRCTVRRGLIFNTDALDMGEYGATGEASRGVLIDSCLLHDFIDKGVSMGVNVDITVTNCVIYNVDAGIAVKDLSFAGIYNTTIADASYGYHCYNKANSGATNGGGFITNSFNNVLWHFASNAVTLLNGSTLTANDCDFESTNWPGSGNISANPLFVDATRHNYRFGAGSPTLGSGLNGANMGATYPVGGIPAMPLNVAALTVVSNQIQLAWTDDADNEDGVEIQRSTDALAWQTIGSAAPDATNFTDATIAMDQRYYYRVRTTNYMGVSAFSSIVGAMQRSPVTMAGGTLTGNTVWSGLVLVMSNVTVPAGLTLTVTPGTVVSLTNAASISALASGVIDVEGSFTNRILFRPMATNGSWGTINASGSGSFLTLRFAELDHGGANLGSQATGVIEDCYVHDVYSAIVGNSALSATVRRCHVNNYSETIYNSTPVLAEDCLLENMTAPDSDALEIQGALAAWHCTVRRCEARHSTGSNSDSYDFNGSSGVLLEDCIAHDFSDKGLSLGASGAGGTADFGITVRNCLFYNVDTGIAIKDGSTLSLFQTTIADSANGLRLYQKYTTPADGGHVTNGWNVLLWGTTNTVSLLNNSSLALDYSDLQATNWPGTSNLSSDPLFVNAAQHDYRLATGSPCLGTGKGGANIGVTFPLGVFIQAPGNLAAVAGSNAVALTWQDNSPSEAVFLIERASDGGAFTSLACVPLNTSNYMDSAVLVGHNYRYRVRGANINTNSDYSLEASASVGQPPVITSQPASLVVAPGANAAFTVAASGLGTLAVAWQHNGVHLTSDTNATLGLTNVQAANAGDYQAIVTDGVGLSATSAVARLTVVAPPQVGLGGSGMDSNRQFSLQFTAPTNITVVIETSTNLHDWLPVQTNNSGDGSIQFTDPASTNFWDRFYRALLRP